MKKIMVYLNSIKSRCFMLVVCFALLMGVSSCNSDDLEVNAPEPKGLSKAELIELALSRMPPQTRANAPFPVVMVITNKTVTINCYATEDMVINRGDGLITPILKNYSSYTHTYSDNQPSYGIFLEGSNEAITSLNVDQDGLIYLDVTNNTKLEQLFCRGNLDALDLTGCSNLSSLWADHNNLS